MWKPKGVAQYDLSGTKAHLYVVPCNLRFLDEKLEGVTYDRHLLDVVMHINPPQWPTVCSKDFETAGELVGFALRQGRAVVSPMFVRRGDTSSVYLYTGISTLTNSSKDCHLHQRIW